MTTHSWPMRSEKIARSDGAAGAPVPNALYEARDLRKVMALNLRLWWCWIELT